MPNIDFTERTGTVASKTIRSKYPAQIAVMTTDENKERFQAEAERDGVSVAEVIRGYLEAGISSTDNREATYVGGESLGEATLHIDVRSDIDPASRAEEVARERQYGSLL